VIGGCFSNFLAMGFFMMTTTTTMDEWVAETDLAESLGVSAAVLRKARLEWLPPELTKKEGRRLLLSREAVVLLSDRISIPVPVAKKERVPVEVRVKKVPMNPRIVVGLLDGVEVRVRVRDSRKFVPGMLMKCVGVDEGVFELVGRGPRFKGRW
jgi:hypothetical protein